MDFNTERVRYENISVQLRIGAGVYTQPYAVVASIKGVSHWITYYRNCLPEAKKVLAKIKDAEKVGDSRSDWYACVLSTKEADSIRKALELYDSLKIDVKDNLSLSSFIYASVLSAEGVDLAKKVFYD